MGALPRLRRLRRLGVVRLNVWRAGADFAGPTSRTAPDRNRRLKLLDDALEGRIA